MEKSVDLGHREVTTEWLLSINNSFEKTQVHVLFIILGNNEWKADESHNWEFWFNKFKNPSIFYGGTSYLMINYENKFNRKTKLSTKENSWNLCLFSKSFRVNEN